MYKLNPKVTCDNCYKDFRIRFKTEKKNDIEKTYFKCPHCKHEYIGIVTNSNIRAKQKEMLELLIRANKQLGTKESDKLFERAERLSEEIKREMEELKSILTKEALK